MRPLVVVAIGGNALVGVDGRLDVATQRANARGAAERLALLAESNDIVVTHGNGPQVGMLAMQAAADTTMVPPPLDVLDAESAGLIGYILVESLSAHLAPQRVVAVLTRVEVDAADPAFATATKAVGPWFPAAAGEALAELHGWELTRGQRGVRRVVASPRPLRVVELEAVSTLSRLGTVVIACGGGGIPVVWRAGELVGVEAVVDKDLTSALLAVALDADRFVVLTDVEAIYSDYGRPSARPLAEATPAALGAMLFPAGSMGPKVEAVCSFVEHTGRSAAIGALAQAEAVLDGRAGTRVVPDHS